MWKWSVSTFFFQLKFLSSSAIVKNYLLALMFDIQISHFVGSLPKILSSITTCVEFQLWEPLIMGLSCIVVQFVHCTKVPRGENDNINLTSAPFAKPISYYRASFFKERKEGRHLFFTQRCHQFLNHIVIRLPLPRRRISSNLSILWKIKSFLLYMIVANLACYNTLSRLYIHFSQINYDLRRT